MNVYGAKSPAAIWPRPSHPAQPGPRSVIPVPASAILGIESVRTVLYVPVFERLIGTVRREYLDRLFFWNAGPEKKLSRFKNYFNQARVHQGLAGITPNQAAGQPPQPRARLPEYHW